MLESLPMPSPTLEIAADPFDGKTEVLVAGLSQDGKLSPSLQKLDAQTSGAITRLVESRQLRGKLGEMNLLALSNESIPVVLVV